MNDGGVHLIFPRIGPLTILNLLVSTSSKRCLNLCVIILYPFPHRSPYSSLYNYFQLKTLVLLIPLFTALSKNLVVVFEYSDILCIYSSSAIPLDNFFRRLCLRLSYVLFYQKGCFRVFLCAIALLLILLQTFPFAYPCFPSDPMVV